MTSQKQLGLLRQGVATWNEWREKNLHIIPDLRRVVLSSAILSDANLSEVDLSGATLRGTRLIGANLSGAKLIGADLSGAYLAWANLNGAYLSGAYLVRAHLMNATLITANLNGANLRNADFSGANLSEATFIEANLSKATLDRANLSGALLLSANLTQAILNNCNIYGISAWNLQLERAEQHNLVITPDNEPVITVDDLEVAQFIYLLLNHKKLRNVLNAVTERGVLLLGRFDDGGLELLQAIAARLREEHYLPIIFDFGRPQDRNFTETVKTLAGLSRFIIADLSGPSVPQELYATVPHFKIPFVPIIEAGRRPYAMAVDLLEYPWVVRPPIVFASTEELLSLIPSKIIAPAEEKHQVRQQLLDELFRRK